MDIGRILKHLLTPAWAVRRAFPPVLLQRIEQAIGASEAQHAGELRFAVEAGLDLPEVLAGRSARERAIDVFSELRVWDTEGNSGVLIYVQLVDRRVEILADRGIDRRVAPGTWDAVCRRLEQAYHEGRFEQGSLLAIEEITALLRAHFPRGEGDVNELPDRPVLL